MDQSPELPSDEPRAMREMTPNEIRYDELSQLLDFVQGDPIDGAPSKKAIIAGIKHRLGELVTVTEAPTAEQPSEPEEPSWFDQMDTVLGQLRHMTDRAEVREDRGYLAEAVATGLELLKMSIELTDERNIVDRYQRRQLGNAIAVRLAVVINDPRWEE